MILIYGQILQVSIYLFFLPSSPTHGFIIITESLTLFQGDSRWNYHSVLKYFKRLEDYHGHWKDNGKKTRI